MKTEEIIIDGVNVAGCDYYYRCDCKIDDDTDINLCKWHDDCYYKQLKRLEQENRELRKANEISIEKVTVTAEAKRLQELEQENKDLKKQIESDKGLITIGGKQQYEYLQRIDELKKTVENQKLEYEELQCDLSEVENACGCYQSENAELKQENKELKIKLSSTKCYLCGEGFLTPEGTELYEENKELKSALEEINITVKQLLKGVSSNCINNTPYLTALSLIENKINECIE